MRYRTIKNIAEDFHIQSRSRFIGSITPVKSEEEALSFLADIKKQHWNAKHHAYAYILLDGNFRFSDDGEPPATAGRPIYDVLNGAGLTDVCLVVTRYFGGVLLGTGGLARAYSKAAKLAVKAAAPINMCLYDIADLRCEYPFYSKILSFADEYGIKIIESLFGDDVFLTLAVNKENKKAFERAISDAGRRKIHLDYKDSKFLEEKSQ